MKELEALGGEAMKLEAERLETALASAKEELTELEKEERELMGRLGREDLVGLTDRLEAARVRTETAEDAHAELKRRADAAKLLQKTLLDCRDAARRAFLEPLQQEVQPLLDCLSVQASVDFSESFELQRFARNGSVDTFDELSGGAKEQLSLVIRLAMAKVIAGDGTVPVLLDDALVHTDSDRFQRMAVALFKAAMDLQIIVATWNKDRFRTIGIPAGQFIDLGALIGRKAFDGVEE